MKSKKLSEPLDLDSDLPTSAEDLAALRRLRQTTTRVTQVDLQLLRAERLGDFQPGRKTSAGWEPFEL